MRLFIAICFDENMLDSLTEIQDDLIRCGVKGNYTARENLHMTLAFIGDYDDPEQIEEVMQNVPLRSFSSSIALSSSSVYSSFSSISISSHVN